MIDHPLVIQSQEKDVTAVSQFARAAREITGVQLAKWYRRELEVAPKRAKHDKLYFVGCCLSLYSENRGLIHPGLSRSGVVEKPVDSGTPADAFP